MPTYYISLHDLNNSDDWKRQFGVPEGHFCSSCDPGESPCQCEEQSDSDPETGIQYGDLT